MRGGVAYELKEEAAQVKDRDPRKPVTSMIIYPDLFKKLIEDAYRHGHTAGTDPFNQTMMIKTVDYLYNKSTDNLTLLINSTTKKMGIEEQEAANSLLQKKEHYTGKNSMITNPDLFKALITEVYKEGYKGYAGANPLPDGDEMEDIVDRLYDEAIVKFSQITPLLGYE